MDGVNLEMVHRENAEALQDAFMESTQSFGRRNMARGFHLHFTFAARGSYGLGAVTRAQSWNNPPRALLEFVQEVSSLPWECGIPKVAVPGRGEI